MHATEFLKKKSPDVPAITVLFGDEPHFKRGVRERIEEIVLGGDEDAASTRFPGEQADLQSVLDEVRTVSMWGDTRLVVVEDADKFVSNFRSGLEKYVPKPSKGSTLILEVNSWPKNTKLAKAVAASPDSTAIECKAIKGAALVRWLKDEAASVHEKKLGPDAAGLIVELAGDDLGLLSQELSKLSAYAGDRSEISVEDVTALVGGWSTKTTFEMLSAIRTGDIDSAMRQLDALLTAGEAPQRVLGGINYTYRRIMKGVDESSKGTPLAAALKSAGVFPREIGQTEQYLRRVGRPRAEQFRNVLLRADESVKGGGRLPDRVELERLLIALSGANAEPAAV
ncbi:DNA polymerase III subunit delta [Stratiformator vulcanicus]|uniref:DNA polymerase III subunit delta n=1 Tax=Stratiformator vulcanicus TaxID=2527980 RepID=A0A517R5V8_9PLAN|nr:DNA polymerase III subunit delta [Stratiformator vulcanicus]QDT39213.1 DNA polymerase III subunit delta [Stratiformator vulcanicus]